MSVIVIGSGSWGKALAKVFGAGEVIAGRDAAKEIKAEYVFVAVEAQKFREVISRHKFSPEAVLIICSKGIEQGSLKLLGDIVEEILPNQYAVLSGPNFADELSNGLPAATTIACKSESVGNKIIKDLAKPHFRLYLTDDVVATQVGGAVKNVIAIASGIAIGKKFGENARAAIITRGIAEISRLATALGGKAETLMGLGGFGDMILTCTSEKSRNTSFGVALAKKPLIVNRLSFIDEARVINDEQLTINDQKRGVVEGYYTAKSVNELAKKLKIEMPICFMVHEILYNGKDINEAINDLLKRPQG